MGSTESEYDACYYEVVLDEKLRESEEYTPKKINIRITAKSSNVNAFIYGGKSRLESKDSVTPNNEQVSTGQ